MSHLNQSMLIGNLGKDPEVLKTTDQGNFVRLSIATTKKYKDKNGDKQVDTQWHVVYLSNRLGKVAASYLKKGDKVFISGELRTREWFDDEGLRHFSTSVYAREMKFLSAKSQNEKVSNPESIEDEKPYETAMQQIRETLGDHCSMSN
jgi:single-strand DNA-binding protein